MKPRLLVDLDNTISDLFANANHLFTNHFPCRWDFDKCCTTHSLNHVFSMTHLFENAPPQEDAIEGVKFLMTEFDVLIVSAPWPTNHAANAAKFRWVDRHFGRTDILILASKKDVIEAVALVDDKPNLVGPWEHVTYPQPWNQSTWPKWRDGLAEQLVEKFCE